MKNGTEEAVGTAPSEHSMRCIPHDPHPQNEEHVKKGGKPRMARYPWMYFANIVMKTKSFSIEEVTYYDQHRRYKRLNVVVNQLYNDKKITTRSPLSMKIDDIKTILEHRRSQVNPKTGKQLGKAELHKDQVVMRAMFNHPEVNNKNFDKCLAQYPGFKVIRNPKRLPPIEEDDFKKLIKRANAVAADDNVDFDMLRAYFAAVLASNTGARTIEILNMKVEDVDVNAMEIFLRVVKGMNTYGKQRIVPILPNAKNIVRSYLIRLESWKEKYGLLENPYLFPSSHRDGKGPIVSNTLIKSRNIVKSDLGIEFDFRMCRRTFYQQLLDLGIDSDDGSVVMGNTVGVLEKHYGHRRPRMVLDKIKSRFCE